MKRVATMLIVLSFFWLAGSAQGRTWHIKSDGSGDAPTIQAAIDSAAVGDSVAVNEGTYFENIVLKIGVKVLGGWNSSFTLRDPQAYTTTIDGLAKGSVVAAYWPVDSTSVIDGFLITNGCGTEDPMNPGVHLGGGIFVYWTPGPTITNNQIRGNRVVTNGGGAGISIHDAAPIVRGNLIVENSCPEHYAFGAGIKLGNSGGQISGNVIANNNAGGDGGGLRADGGTFLFVDNEVFGNTSGINGGGLSLDHSLAYIGRNKITGNVASALGGGIFGYAISSDVEWNVIADNSAGSGGGMLFLASPFPTVSHNTMVENSSREAGQVSLGEGCSPLVEANIVARDLQGLGIFYMPGCSPTFVCNDVWGNAWGNYEGSCGDQTGVNGNISTDPKFCDPSNYDFHLCENSPCAPGHHPSGANCVLIGALDVGCAPTAVQETTWGKIKAMFR